MSRLTERDPGWLGNEYWTSAREPDDADIDAVYEKLKSYEDAEEAGLLIKLPCKVGDTVYFIDRFIDWKSPSYERRSIARDGYVKAIKFSSRPTKITVEYEDLRSRGRCKGADYHASSIGKTLFLTREEAEAAMMDKEK